MLYLLANNGLLSGRASGNVYQRNGRLRGFAVPKLVQNDFTNSVRNRFGQNSSDWNSLSDDERNSWLSASGFTTSDRFGRTIPLVGKQLFVSLNNNLAAVGIATIAECPLPELVDSITTLTPGTFDNSASTCSLAYAPSPVPANTAVLLFATAPQSAGTSRPGNSKYRVIAQLAPADASPKGVGASYVIKFGVPPVGAKVFFKAVSINTITGQAGVPVFAMTTVVA